MAQLIPIPLSRPSAPPDNADAATMNRWLRSFLEDYDTFQSLVKQNVDALIVDAGAVNAPTSPEQIGNGNAWDPLRGVPVNLSSASTTKGLQLANGSTRNRVNIIFQYLGVGPVIIGSGANVTYTADLTTAGINGLDTGTEAANTWYYVYIIVSDFGPVVVDATTNNNQPPLRRQGLRVASLLSTSATPKLPSGYNRYRRVGMVRNNSTSDLYRFINAVDDDWFQWNEDLEAAPQDFVILAVTTSATVWTDVSAAKVAPPTSREVRVRTYMNDLGRGRMWLQMRNKDWTNSAAVNNLSVIVHGVQLNTTELTQINSEVCTGVNSSQVFQYASNDSTIDVDLILMAYRDIR